MNWQEIYNSKLCSVSEAVARVKSGMILGSGHAAGEPVALLKELGKQLNRLCDVKVYHMNGMADDAYDYVNLAGGEGKIRHYSLFAGKQTRKAIQSGVADFVPCFFSEVPRLFKNRLIKLDACFVHLSKPDIDGYCSYGVSCDYEQAMIESSPLVIAQINEQMPFTYGERVHVSHLDAITEVDHPLLEVAQFDQDADSTVAEQIAGHISKLIPDGANLQLGIGAIPDMVLKFIGDKKDLGIHTEMFSDGILGLIEKGVLTGANNNLHPGKIVACFILGTKRIYDFADKNPKIVMKPVDYTNNIMVAGRLNKLVSINSAIQINFHGEVVADTIGFKQFSGVGGQVDFVRAASLSDGGFSVIAMPSTAKNGQISRIVPQLTEGACVTTSRSDVNYVVTEYGCVNLRGKSIRERKELLISISHPDFRNELGSNRA